MIEHTNLNQKYTNIAKIYKYTDDRTYNSEPKRKVFNSVSLFSKNTHQLETSLLLKIYKYIDDRKYKSEPKVYKYKNNKKQIYYNFE